MLWQRGSSYTPLGTHFHHYCNEHLLNKQVFKKVPKPKSEPPESGMINFKFVIDKWLCYYNMDIWSNTCVSLVYCYQECILKLIMCRFFRLSHALNSFWLTKLGLYPDVSMKFSATRIWISSRLPSSTASSSSGRWPSWRADECLSQTQWSLRGKYFCSIL